MLTGRLFDNPSWRWGGAFDDMYRLNRLFNALAEKPFGGVSAGVFPSVNLTEDTDNYYVRAELPGIKADALDIQAVGRNLTLSGERTIASEGENVRYHRREREAGKFSRIIGLPGDVNTDKVDAKLVNGLLTVTIAKADAAKPKQITIS